jgi:hypothetical protein
MSDPDPGGVQLDRPAADEKLLIEIERVREINAG